MVVTVTLSGKVPRPELREGKEDERRQTELYKHMPACYKQRELEIEVLG